MTGTFGFLWRHWRFFLIEAVALAAAVVLTLILFTRAAYANGGPHGGYSATTSACAGCHRTHQAKSSSKLLTQPSAFLLCMSCHNGSGAATDVVDGVKLDAVAGLLPVNGFATSLNARANGTDFEAWITPGAQPIDATQASGSIFTLYLRANVSPVIATITVETPYARSSSGVPYGTSPFGTVDLGDSLLALGPVVPDPASIVSTTVTIPNGSAGPGDVEVVPVTVTDQRGESYTLTITTWVDDGYNAAGPGGAFDATLLGGGFEYVYGRRVTSRHPADPAEQAIVPWGNAGSGLLTAELANYANGSISPAAIGQTAQRGASQALTSSLECVSCHDPHGNTNYRMLRTMVNGTHVNVKAFTNSAVSGKVESQWVEDTIAWAINGTETITFTEGGTSYTTAALQPAAADSTTLEAVAADVTSKMRAAASDNAVLVSVNNGTGYGEPDGKFLISAWPLSKQVVLGANPVSGNTNLSSALQNMTIPANAAAVNDPTAAPPSFVADEPAKDYMHEQWGSMFAGRASNEGGANASGGLSNFCGACHTAYVSEGASIGLTGGSPSVTHFRHRTETSWLSWIDPRNNNATNAPVDNSGTHNFQRSNPHVIGYNNLGGTASTPSFLPLANAPYNDSTPNTTTTVGSSPANTTYGNASSGSAFNVSAYVLNCETCHRPHGTEMSVSATGMAGQYSPLGATSPAQGAHAGVLTSGVVETPSGVGRIAFNISGVDTVTFTYGDSASLTTPALAPATENATTLSAVASDLEAKLRTASGDNNITVFSASNSTAPGHAVFIVNGPKRLTIVGSTDGGLDTALAGRSNDTSPVAAAQSGVVESGTTEGTIGFAIGGTDTVTFTDNGVTRATAGLSPATAGATTLAAVASDLQSKMQAAANNDASITVTVGNTTGGAEPDGYFVINSTNVIAITGSTNAGLQAAFNTANGGLTNTSSMGPTSFRNAGITDQSTLLRLPERGVCEVCHQWSGRGDGTATP